MLRDAAGHGGAAGAACGASARASDPARVRGQAQSFTALAQLETQRRRGELSDLAFLTRAVALMNGSDATAVLAASTATNGGWLGERKHTYEQALEVAQRSAARP